MQVCRGMDESIIKITMWHCEALFHIHLTEVVWVSTYDKDINIFEQYRQRS
jgi:hypothetical protein